MPLVFQQNINEETQLALWKITELVEFFQSKINQGRPIANPLKLKQHLAGRYLLQLMMPEHDVSTIQNDLHGKPIQGKGMPYFSISHSGIFAAVILSKSNRVAIDIEKYGDKAALLWSRFLKDEEWRIIQEHLTDSIVSGTAAWSVKESLYKYAGNRGVNFRNQLHIEGVTFIEGMHIFNCSTSFRDIKKLEVKMQQLDDVVMTFIVD